MTTPTSEAAAEASPIHILWSDDGQHIRKWDWKSFDGATPYHPTPERGAAGREWRCFHCDEVFVEERCARLHFGRDEGSEPACVIKAGAEGRLLHALRRAEEQADDAMQALHNESTEAAKAYHAQRCRHDQALIAAEELGYERGLADGRALSPDESGRAPTPAAPDGLEELRALSERATPGEWRINGPRKHEVARGRRAGEGYVVATACGLTHTSIGESEANAALIAAAVNHVRAALAKRAVFRGDSQ